MNPFCYVCGGFGADQEIAHLVDGAEYRRRHADIFECLRETNKKLDQLLEREQA